MANLLRKIVRLSAVIALGLAAAAARAQTAGALPALSRQEVAQRHRDGYVLAKPRAAHMAAVDGEEGLDGTKTWRKFPRFGGLRVIKLKPGETIAAGIARLMATGRYEYVEPDYVKHVNSTPNDTDFNEQWGLANTGANPTIDGPGLAGADIHATTAWTTRTDASSVVVAVVDTGARLTHTDLVANLWRNPTENQDHSYANDLYGINPVGGNGTPADDFGHGTHVSGIIGAVGNNGMGISGVAWKVQLMELKAGDSDGFFTSVNVVTCLDFALAHHAAVINASFGGPEYEQSMYTAIQQLQTAGIIFVAAAGNDNEDNGLSPSYPADYPLDNIVSVGASDNRDDFASFSAFGSGMVDLFAPGDQIVSLYFNSDSDIATLSGTSMSAPLVTGSLALLKAQYPGDTYRQLINRLLRTVDANANFLGLAQTAGRLDLAQALTSAAGANTPFNDNFSARAHLAGSLVTVRSSNSGAGLDAGEPVTAGTVGGASLWWDWTAPVSGVVTVSTAGSAYAAVVGVYTGTSLPSLTLVAGNANPGVGTAAVTFTALAGNTYEITVDGQNGATGQTILNLVYANDAFATPVTLAGRGPGLTASNIFASTEAGEPRILNNTGGHSLWYSWTAPTGGQYQISVYSPDFDPLLAVYTGSTLNSLSLLSAGAGASIASTEAVPASFCTCTFTAVAGVTYAIAVDGNVDGNAKNEQYAHNSGINIGAGQFTLTIADSTWQAAAGDAITCTPTIGPDGTVYVGSDDAVLYAFNPDGTTKWSTSAGGYFDSSSAALSPDGGTLYAGSGDGNLYAFSTATGAVVWKFPVAVTPVACSPAVAVDGTVYVRDSGTTLYAVTPAGATKWTFNVPGMSYAAPVIAPDGTIYIGSDNGLFYAITPGASGASLKWTFNTNSASVTNNAVYTAAAVDAAGNVYFGTLGGTFYALTPAGNQIWSFTAGNSISSSPALSASGGTVYFGSYDHKLYALSTANGALQWAYTAGGEFRASSPAIDANGVIYVGCRDNNLYAINVNGTLGRIYATGNWVRSSPAISGTSLYFASNDHRLYAYAIGAGPAASPWPMYMNNPRRFGRLPGPAISSQPQSATVAAGASVTLTAAATGAASYQWYDNGVAIAGATGSSLALTDVGANQAGSYTVLAIGANGAGTLSNTATLAVSTTSRLINLSVLSNIQGSLSMGFVIGGAGPGSSENLLIRGVGPSIGPGTIFNVGGIMPDPALTVVQQANNAISYRNTGWGANQASVTTADSAVGAFPLSDPTSKDSALVQSLPAVAGGYSATVSGASGDGGYALTEVYDDTLNYTAASPRLVNLSCLATIPGKGGLDVGFVVNGPSGTASSETLLVRVTGPALGLAPFSLPGTMPDPQLSVHPSNVSANPSAPVASNAGWGGNTQITAADSLTGAFALTNPASKDSAVLITVPAGVPYTVEVSSASGAAGTVLVELYELR